MCSKSHFPRVAQTLFFSGSLIGALLGGPITDMNGRKLIFCIFSVLSGVFSLFCTFATDLYMWAIFRFFCGVTVLASSVGINVYITEVLGGKWRSLINSYAGASSAQLGIVTLGTTAYFVNDMVILEYVMAAMGLLGVVVWFLLPESPRWLLVHGRQIKGMKAVKEIVKINKRHKLSDEDFEELTHLNPDKEETDDKRKGRSILDLFKYAAMRRNILIMLLVWPATNMSFYGLYYNTPTFGWNVCLVFMAPVIINIPVIFIVPLLDNKFGRKVMLTVPMFVSACLALITIIIPKSNEIVITVFCLLALAIVNMAYITMFVYTKELFPTVLRSTAFSACSTAARIGSILFPMIAELDTVSPVLPVVTYGGLLLLAAIASIWIWPDTSVLKLPDTIEEGEAMSSTKNNWLKCNCFKK